MTPGCGPENLTSSALAEVALQPGGRSIANTPPGPWYGVQPASETAAPVAVADAAPGADAAPARDGPECWLSATAVPATPAMTATPSTATATSGPRLRLAATAGSSGHVPG